MNTATTNPLYDAALRVARVHVGHHPWVAGLPAAVAAWQADPADDGQRAAVRQLCQGFAVPEGACGTFRRLLQDLQDAVDGPGQGPTPFDVLSAEHRVIEQVLSVLACMADAASRRGTAPDWQDAADIVHFIATFADACHHGKEEALLFTAVERRDPGFTPTVVMRHEHDAGRLLVARMRAAIGVADTPAWAESAVEFVDLLRAHIQKEDHCLWAMAAERLDAAAQAELMAGFREVEQSHLGADTHLAMMALADRLAERYGVPCVTAGDARLRHLLVCCCGH
jgi:hemerythrin-like domain-containing protein